MARPSAAAGADVTGINARPVRGGAIGTPKPATWSTSGSASASSAP
jgi:hypothetical protein